MNIDYIITKHNPLQKSIFNIVLLQNIPNKTS